LNQTVPGSLSPGNYQYIAYVTDQVTQDLLTRDFVAFEKLPGNANPEHNSDWALYGWNAEEVLTLTPAEFTLLPPFPNPFNPSTTIRFSLPQAALVKLEVFDVKGRNVGAKQSAACFAHYAAGTHEIPFDGSGLPSGIYFARLMVGDYSVVQKLVLMK
ncbi:MAG: T9SS type A sorting domain-containing protein, partial [bacterium]